MPLIAHVATRFLASGTERSLQDVISALPAPEYEHLLIVGREHQPESIRRLVGDIRTVVVPSLIRQPDPIQDVRAVAALARLIRRNRPTLLHTIQSKSGILGRSAGRIVGVPAMVHTVNMANFGPGFHPLLSVVYRTAERVAGRWTVRFPVNGSELRDRFIAARIGTPDQYVLIRSSVDTEDFKRMASRGQRAARADLDLPTDVPILLFAGSLDKRKGAQELPSFLSAVHARVPQAMLMIAGDGPLRGRVESEMRDRGLDKTVRWLGFTKRLPEAMAAADCLVMLSRAEGLATVLVHAVASGTPFVSYDVDGPGELIKLGASGAVGPMGDWQRAAELTCSLLESADPRPVPLGEWSRSEVRRRYQSLFEGVLQGVNAR